MILNERQLEQVAQRAMEEVRAKVYELLRNVQLNVGDSLQVTYQIDLHEPESPLATFQFVEGEGAQDGTAQAPADADEPLMAPQRPRAEP